MDDAPLELSQEAAAAFRVEPVSYLGGRMRKHWRVRRGGEDLVLTRYMESEASILYELRALQAVAEAGWPVPVALDGPMRIGDRWWTLARWLPGEPFSEEEEPRQRGRLLAEFHASTFELALPSPNDSKPLKSLIPSPPAPLPQRGEGRSCLGPRPGFRRAERVLEDPEIERTLIEAEARFPEETGIVRWHLDRARTRLEGFDLAAMPSRLIHGDFTTWNLRFVEGKLSGIIDFELAREDHRVAEFFHAWRGKYDAVVHAYDEVVPLEPPEWEILTPLWWLFLVDLWCGSLQQDMPDDGWVIAKLRERSPLMGPDRDARPR